jgi:hypothetical protein
VHGASVGGGGGGLGTGRLRWLYTAAYRGGSPDVGAAATAEGGRQQKGWCRPSVTDDDQDDATDTPQI